MTNFDVKVNGNKISFNVGVLFLGYYQQKNKIDLDELIQKIQDETFLYVPDFMYESAVYKSHRQGKKFKYSKEKFLDMLDDEGIEAKAMNEFLELFVKSISENIPKEDDVEEPKSKKK